MGIKTKTTYTIEATCDSCGIEERIILLSEAVPNVLPDGWDRRYRLGRSHEWDPYTKTEITYESPQQIVVCGYCKTKYPTWYNLVQSGQHTARVVGSGRG